MPGFNPKTVLTKEHLTELYLNRRLSASEIALELGCGETTVLRALDRHGISRRSRQDYRIDIPQSELERLYLDEKLSESEIAARFGTSQITISRRLIDTGIQTRPVGSVPAYSVPKGLFGAWSPNLAYAVGLLATDGSLDKDRKRIEFVSADIELIELFLTALRLGDVHVVVNQQPMRRPWYSVKISDSDFREFLEYVGLTPGKSKTIGALKNSRSCIQRFCSRSFRW